MDEDDATREKIQRVINAICEWLYPKRCRKETVLLRAFTWIWFLRPEWLGNPTQAELAKQLNVTKQVLGKTVNKMREQFGFYVTGMRGEEARKKFAAHAKRNAGALAEARRQAYKRSIR